MWPFDPPADRTPSALWMWGFWAYTGTAVALFVLSTSFPLSLGLVLRGAAGAFLFVGGAHQVHVVAYKRTTRGPYSTFGPNSYQIQRQMGWSAMVLGLFFIASALVGL